MPNYAIVDSSTGQVANVVEYDEQPSNPPPGYEDGVIAVQHAWAGPGWTWNGETLTAPEVLAGQVVPASISDRQFFQQLAIDGIITEDQALAANAAVIPAPLLDIINMLPSDQRFDAKMKISGATIFLRNDPLTNAIGQAYGMSPAAIDEFFISAGVL